MIYKAMLIHLIADFLLQTREMGKKKSSSPKWLFAHILIIAICFLPLGVEFAVANAIFHFFIDAIIWNLYKVTVYIRNPYVVKESYDYWNDHLFYFFIGLDQFLHYTTIVYLIEVL